MILFQLNNKINLESYFANLERPYSTQWYTIRLTLSSNIYQEKVAVRFNIKKWLYLVI